MKKNMNLRYVTHPLSYPNAAQPRYFLNKFIDAVLATVTSAGTFVILFFLMTM